MLTQVEQEELDQLYEVLMAKYFIHNDEQELLQGHELLNNVPSGWTVVDYQNEGEQADISDAALAIESSTGINISGHPSVVLQLNLFDGLFNADGSKNTTNRTLQWKCLHVDPVLNLSWTDIQTMIDTFVTLNDANHTALQNETRVGD
jgi:hypothetical protein